MKVQRQECTTILTPQRKNDRIDKFPYLKLAQIMQFDMLILHPL